MVSFKTVIAICLGATLCAAQTINITGVVKESGGATIAGASVKLVKANITTITGGGGSFTLTNTTTGAIHNGSAVSRPVGKHHIGYNRNSLTINSSEQAIVSIRVFNVSGRQVLSVRHSMPAGSHTIPIQNLSGGLHIFKISINNEQHLLKSVIGGSTAGNFTFERGLGFIKGFAKKASSMSDSSSIPDTTNTIKDTLVISKEGFITTHRYIRDSIVDLGTITLMKHVGPADTAIVVIDTARDFEGNEYPAIRIGNQVWTITNLRSTKYNDGTAIPHVIAQAQWRNLTTSAYSYYENDTTNTNKYGALYNWYAVNTGKLAPAGWRVPTDADWNTLENYLIANGYNWDGTTSGNKIAKSMAAKTDWDSSTNNGAPGNDLSKNNASGFSALPGGFRNGDGTFPDSKIYTGYWWSATEKSSPSGSASLRRLQSNVESLFIDYGHQKWGLSVRLLRD